MIADMSLSKAESLAKVAKDAAAIENITPGEALEKLLMAIESGASRGLRTMGIFVDLNKEVDRQEKLTGRALGENEVFQLRYNSVMRVAAKSEYQNKAGAATAASGSAEAQSKALARDWLPAFSRRTPSRPRSWRSEPPSRVLRLWSR